MFDKHEHLRRVNGAITIRIEQWEDSAELHICKLIVFATCRVDGLSHELAHLILVKHAIAIGVVGVPDALDCIEEYAVGLCVNHLALQRVQGRILILIGISPHILPHRSALSHNIDLLATWATWSTLLHSLDGLYGKLIDF